MRRRQDEDELIAAAAEMADAARVVRPRLKTLFITGYAEQAVVGHASLAKGMHVMTKPFELAELGRRIRALIEGGL